jgi:acid phosphatase (class A)
VERRGRALAWLGSVVTATRRNLLLVAAWLPLLAGGGTWWWQNKVFHYLPGSTDEFVALFPPPSAADAVATRHELDELLELQRARTPAQIDAAQDDRRKDLSRFYTALGFDRADPPKLPALKTLTDHVEADIGPYVRAAKHKFRRLRPYEIEARLKPCIGNVRGDQSYPSGHATYGYVMEGVLAELVPERRVSLEKRADQFARQRMVCGVHFRSDLEAGRVGAHYLVEHLNESAEFRREANAASAELRAALELPEKPSPR